MAVVMNFMWRHQLALSSNVRDGDLVLSYRCTCRWESVATPVGDRKERERQRDVHRAAHRSDLCIRFEIIA